MEQPSDRYKRWRTTLQLSNYEKENAVLKQRVELLEKELTDNKYDDEHLRKTYERS